MAKKPTLIYHQIPCYSLFQNRGFGRMAIYLVGWQFIYGKIRPIFTKIPCKFPCKQGGMLRQYR